MKAPVTIQVVPTSTSSRVGPMALRYDVLVDGEIRHGNLTLEEAERVAQEEIRTDGQATNR